MRCVLLALVLVFGVAIGSPSRADADAKAEAVVLFDQGLKDMKAGNYAKACTELAVSNAQWPDSGTKGSLARCLTHVGQLSAAWLLWRELADTAPTNDLRSDAAVNAARLEPRLARFSIKSAAQVPGLTVTINGATVDAAHDIAVPIDPGKLVIVARAPHHEEWHTEVIASAGATSVIAIPILIASGDGPHRDPPPLPAIDDHPRHQRRVIALAVGGLGAVAMIGGGLFGLRANSQWNDANTTCGGSVDHCPTSRLDPARKQVSDARSSATLSTVMLGVGSAAAIAGVLLWVTAPEVTHHGISLAPSIAPTYVGIAVTGTL